MMMAKVPKSSGGVMAVMWIALVQLPAVAAVGAGMPLQEDAHFSRTVRIGPSGALDLSNVSGDIEIRGGSGADIRIDAEINGDPSLVNIDVSQTGDRVRVQTRYRNGKEKGPSVDFTVAIPVGVAISARSVSGDVAVNGVEGAVQAESVSGDVTISDCGNLRLAKSVSGDLTIRSVGSREEAELASVSGDVVVNGLKAPRMAVSSVSGDVRLTDADCGNASVESVSGALHYGGRFIPNGRYEFQSHSGDVRLHIANEVGFELAAQTFSGEIESDFPLTLSSGRRSEREIRGVYDDGSALIEASTFSGNISITKD